MLKFVSIREDQRTCLQLLVFVPRHRQARVHDTDVSALHVLDHQIQAVQPRAQGNGFLINRLQLQRLLEKRIREIAADGILKRLHPAASESSQAPENIEYRGENPILRLKRKLA